MDSNQTVHQKFSNQSIEVTESKFFLIRSLFSSSGRISRTTYFFVVAISSVLALMFCWFVFFSVAISFFSLIFELIFLNTPKETQVTNLVNSSMFSMLFIVLTSIVIIFICLWILIIATIKRLHDIDKSGWWSMLLLIPIIGWLWLLVECGCLKGSTGQNQYGPDPLDPLEKTGNSTPVATETLETIQTPVVV